MRNQHRRRLHRWVHRYSIHHHRHRMLLNYLTNTSRGLLKLIGTLAGHQTIFLVDCGATGNFISSEFVSRHELKSSSLLQPDAITLADGSKQSTGSFLKSASIHIGSYTDEVDFVSIPLVGADVILGMPWLGHYNPDIDWIKNTISFIDENGIILWQW